MKSNFPSHQSHNQPSNLNSLELIEKEDKFKLELIATVSHEIRTPLAITKQLVSLIHDGTAGTINSKQREILIKTQANLDRLKNILDEMLDLSKIEKDKFNLKYTLVNLKDLLRDIEQNYQNLINEKKIKLKLAIPTQTMDVFIDAERTRQAISNLLNNAIKFSHVGGTICLDAKTYKEFVHISVHDQGIGIAPENCEKIFDKFVKLPQQDVFMSQGIGLGLAIVQEIVQKQGGDVWVKSTLGKGSSFTISLPRLHTVNAINLKNKSLIAQKIKLNSNVGTINLRIINFSDIQNKISISPAKLVNELSEIFKIVTNDIFNLSLNKKINIISDTQLGTIHLIFESASKNSLDLLSKVLTEKIKSYCLKNNLMNVFIAVGCILITSTNKNSFLKSSFSELPIKEIYISSDMRRAKRITYASQLEVLWPQHAAQQGKTVDIFYYGVCFIGEKPLRIDQHVRIQIYLLRTRKLVEIIARVAWNSEMNTPISKTKKFKIGMEFLKFKKGEYEKLLKELKYYL